MNVLSGLFPDFTGWQLLATAMIFIWSGFVRSGLGFGGAALGLPFMLLIYDQPIFWIPVIGSHLLFFSGLTLSNRETARHLVRALVHHRHDEAGDAVHSRCAA